MATNELFLAQAQPWIRANARSVLRSILPIFIFAVVWWFASLSLPAAATLELIVYAAANLGLIALMHYMQTRQGFGWQTALLVLSAMTDVLLALSLLNTLGPLTPAIFPTYAILAIKTMHHRRQFLWMLLAPILLGPIYLSSLYLRAEGPQQLPFHQLIAYWGLLIGSFAFIVLLVVMAEYRLRSSRRQAQKLERSREEYESRVLELESVNTDLRVRIRSQQALEESLRAITGSLSLDDVLSQILDSMMQMLGATRVSAAALTLVKDSGFTHRTLSFDPALPTCWAEPLAQWVIRERAALVVGDALQERAWRELYRCGAVSALSVPLIDVDGVVRGALTVVSTIRYAFTSTEVRHLNSFSIQASVAIHNAELHSQIARQQAMLEAVLRDINDGLMVLDSKGAMVMANPIAYQVLATSDALKAGLREQLAQLALDTRKANAGTLSRELRIGNQGEENERVYQALASLVRVFADNASHVAIVLHDVTDHKAEERVRTEFISMVSHELRNPLNTLSGFLKLVLQGRTGSLNELQHEFLALADGQADQLKGRIAELLEFNRLEAGRLRLQPDWCDLRTLLLKAGSRFQLQAEQAGLILSCAVPAMVPEVLIDGNRIDQVITNLVENAIKATSAGGTIEIGAEVCDTEIRIFVSDTGVGIPLEEQKKIFGRFYRLHHKASHHGAHLGLGLSICQQIVEGHNGRIWVESEVGHGSRFWFTIPMVAREQEFSAIPA